VPEGLADGGYVVDWQVVSADGHPIAGAFTFAVGDAPLPDAPASDGGTESGPAIPLLRGATYAGLALVLGAAAFALWCWPAGRRHPRVVALVVTGSVVAAVAGAARLVAEAAALDASLDETLGLRSGRAWAALAVLGVAGLLLAAALRSRIEGRLVTAGWVVHAAATGVAVALAGHGASGRAAFLGAALTVVHVVVASVWVGGLAALAVCLLTADARAARTAARAFSGIAAGCVAAVVATGAAQSLRQVGGLDELTSTSYGRTLLVKLAVVAALVSLAWWSRRTVAHAVAGRPGRDVRTSSLLRTVALECGLAIVVFGVTGWLAGEPPGARTGAGETSTPGDTGTEASVSQDGVDVTVRLVPATVGSNRVEVEVVTGDGEAPDEVQASLRPADGAIAPIDVELDVEPGAATSGTATGEVDVPFAGSWYVDVAARFGEFDLVEAEVALNVAPG
jgi:copper transport protein